jgi:uncharacterized protein
MSLARIAFVGLVALACAPPAAAITDCSRPKTKTDWMLCSNDRAAMEEQRMARAFRDAVNRTEDRRSLLDQQKEWSDQVRDACNDIACLTRVLRERTEELEGYRGDEGRSEKANR